MPEWAQIGSGQPVGTDGLGIAFSGSSEVTLGRPSERPCCVLGCRSQAPLRGFWLAASVDHVTLDLGATSSSPCWA